MSRFIPSGDNLIPKLASWKPKISAWWRSIGTLLQVLVIDEQGNISSVDTRISELTVGDFNPPTDVFAIESNWTNNLMTNNTPTGSPGDSYFGVFENGCKGLVKYTQSGWQRFYNDNKLKGITTLGLSIINWLITDNTWSGTGYASTTNTGFGDTGQEYIQDNYHYICRSNDGVTHIWERLEVFAKSITINSEYLPRPQIEVTIANNSTFEIEATTEIISLVAKMETTLGGSISIGSIAGSSDYVPLTTLKTTIGETQQLLYTVDTDAISSVPRTLYVTISTSATVTLYILKQKLFD